MIKFTVPPPIIMPLMEKVSVGQTTTFNITAGFDVKGFQWQRNKMNITDGDKYLNATTSNLTIMNIGQTEEGNYSCIVTTTFGLGIISQQAQLKVCKCEIYSIKYIIHGKCLQ